MTPDPEKVREALELVDDGCGVYDEVTPTLEIIIEAARAWLTAANLDGAEVLWFCTTHKQSGRKPNKSCVWAQAFGRYGAVNQSKDCRMVEGRWIPLPDKETPNGDFYEEDEPIEDIKAAWEQGEKGYTKPNIIEGNTFLPPDKETPDEGNG